MPKGVLARSVGRLLHDLIWTAAEMAEPSDYGSVQCHGVKRRVSLLAVELDVAFSMPVISWQNPPKSVRANFIAN